MKEYVKIINPTLKSGNSYITAPPSSRAISNAIVGRIYRLLDRGVDYCTIRVRGKPVCIESWACQTSSQEEYLSQDKRMQAPIENVDNTDTIYSIFD